MALMDAKEYDPRPAQRRWRLIGGVVVLLIVVGGLWWWFRYWPEEHAVNKFFEALERQDFETAYSLYKADPAWKQHPEKYKDDYPFPQFKLDWGPSGEYGPISSHSVDCSTELKRKRCDRGGQREPPLRTNLAVGRKEEQEHYSLAVAGALPCAAVDDATMNDRPSLE